MTIKKEIILDRMDSSFSTEAAFLYQCICLLDEDVLHFSIFGEKTRKLLKLSSFDLSNTPLSHREDLLKEILSDQSTFLENSFLNQFIHVSPDFSLVPHAFNEGNSYSGIYRQVIETDDEITTTVIEPLDLDLVTTHPFTRVLSDGLFTVHHFMGKLIQYCSANYASSDKNVAIVYQLEKATLFLLFRNEKLTVANQYQVKGPKDVSYFVFASMKSYDVKPELATLYLGGNLQDSLTLVEIFNKYVLEVYKMTPSFNYVDDLEDVDPILTADICST